MRTLVLNASMEPIAVTDWQRAITMVLDDRAIVVEADEDNPIRSQHESWPRPTVIRLVKYVRIPYEATVALNKRNLYDRDRGECQYCRRRMGVSAATIDHVIPRSRGGRHDWTNVVASCSPCNFTKGDQLLSELGWQLPTTPRVPRREGRHIITGEVDDDRWVDYLTA